MSNRSIWPTRQSADIVARTKKPSSSHASTPRPKGQARRDRPQAHQIFIRPWSVRVGLELLSILHDPSFASMTTTDSADGRRQVASEKQALVLLVAIAAIRPHFEAWHPDSRE